MSCCRDETQRGRNGRKGSVRSSSNAVETMSARERGWPVRNCELSCMTAGLRVLRVLELAV